MLCFATSLASVFCQPTSAGRMALEMARFGIGSITPDEITEMIRPHPRSIMPGSARSARRTRPTNMPSNEARHCSDETPMAEPGGGPPELSTSTSTPPTSRVTACHSAST